MDEEWECWESFNVCKLGKILWVLYTQHAHTWESALTCVCCVEQPWREILETGHREGLRGHVGSRPLSTASVFYPFGFLPCSCMTYCEKEKKKKLFLKQPWFHYMLVWAAL